MNIDHLTINVTDLDRSTRFYCEGLAKLEVLGATQLPRSRQQFATAQGAVDVVVCLDPNGQPVELIADRSE